MLANRIALCVPLFLGTATLASLLAATLSSSPIGPAEFRGSAAQSPSPVEVTLYPHTDINVPVPGCPIGVKVPWRPDALGITTTATGMTMPMSLSTDDVLEVIYGEADTSRGQTVGQTCDYAVGQNFGGGSQGYEVFLHHVPEARSVSFDSSLSIISDLHSRHWSATAINNANFNQTVAVATLRNHDVVEALFRYHGHTGSAIPSAYKQGILIRSSRQFPVGDQPTGGLAISIDTSEYSYTNMSADVLLVSDADDLLARSSLARGADLHVDPDGDALIVYTGLVPYGDTLILLRDDGQHYQGGTDEIGMLVSDPVAVPITEPSTGLLDDAGAPSDAEDLASLSPRGQSPSNIQGSDSELSVTTPTTVEDPEPFEPCDPAPPSDSVYCPDRDTVPSSGDLSSDCGPPTADGPLGKRSELQPAWGAGPPPCMPAGVSGGIEICWTREGSISIAAEIADVVEVTGSFGVGKTVCRLVSISSCTCMGTWFCVWKNTQKYNFCVVHYGWSWDPIGLVRHETWSYRMKSIGGVDSVSQPTSCTATTGSCDGSGGGQ